MVCLLLVRPACFERRYFDEFFLLGRLIIVFVLFWRVFCKRCSIYIHFLDGMTAIFWWHSWLLIFNTKKVLSCFLLSNLVFYFGLALIMFMVWRNYSVTVTFAFVFCEIEFEVKWVPMNKYFFCFRNGRKLLTDSQLRRETFFDL